MGRTRKGEIAKLSDVSAAGRIVPRLGRRIDAPPRNSRSIEVVGDGRAGGVRPADGRTGAAAARREQWTDVGQSLTLRAARRCRDIVDMGRHPVGAPDIGEVETFGASH